MQRDPDMASTYDTWRALTSSSTSTPSSTLSAKPSKTSRRDEAPLPSTPRKKARCDSSYPRVSPGNPFRSPQKPSKQYTQTPLFPSRSIEMESTFDSDVSDEETPQQPHLQKTPVKKPANVPTTSPIPLYTPRTKARKRLRGEDVRTPPQAKLQRAPSQARSLGLLAQSPSRQNDKRTFSRIFSASQSHDNDEDVIGPSPSKNNQREFRPLFVAHDPESEIQNIEDDAMMFEPPSPVRTTSSLSTSPLPSLDNRVETSIQVDDADKLIKIKPYRRFRLAKEDDWHDDMDVMLPSMKQEVAPAPAQNDVQDAEHLSSLELRTLDHSISHGQRAMSEQRARTDQAVQGLFGNAGAATASSIVRRVGRAGLDTDEDVPSSLNDDIHDEDWASEASSADYGWGDGGMDTDDIE